jgi:hypothetical protein
MKRLLYLVILLLLLLQACSTPPTAEPPTATSAPTDTPVPTATPQPTDTPTPEPTSTPDKAATAAAQSTASAQTVLAELEDILGEEDIPYQNGQLLWQQEKPLMVSLKGPGWDYAEIDDNLVGRNFILKSDVTWDATGIIICGAIFRSEPDLVKGKQYEFVYLRLSGLPAWQIAYNEFGRFDNSFTKVQYSDAIDQENGATNQVVLVAQDEQFNLYINGIHQGRYFDYSKQRMDGNFAFSGSQDSGEGTCKFENSWVWALEETD